MVRVFRIFVFLMTCLWIPAVAPGLVLADTFAPPKGEVILTVTGAITATNTANGLVLDLAQLEALPQHSFTTSTTWTEGKTTFQGVLLKDLIAAIGAKGKTIDMTALNDYVIEMPFVDVKDDGPLLAYLMDGKTMPLREKGPVWMVFPYDQNPDYRTEETYSRSIWQLLRIDFVE
jgi:hypothetical protein